MCKLIYLFSICEDFDILCPIFYYWIWEISAQHISYFNSGPFLSGMERFLSFKGGAQALILSCSGPVSQLLGRGGKGAGIECSLKISRHGAIVASSPHPLQAISNITPTKALVRPFFFSFPYSQMQIDKFHLELNRRMFSVQVGLQVQLTLIIVKPM